MRLKGIVNAGWVVVLVLPLLLMAGCGMSAYEALDKKFKKMPTHIQNVPPSGSIAIDGVWFNPSVGQQQSIISGREITFIRLTSRDPILPSVLVRDIKQVAPGRFRGKPMVHTAKATHVTYSIIGESKLFTRWHYKTGRKLDVVYDKVKLSNEKWFLSEYEAFLKESQTGGTGSDSQADPTQTARPPGNSSGQTKEVSARTPIVFYKMYTKPGRIAPGTKFDLIIEYEVTDPAVQANRLPVTFTLEILKTKNTFQASSLKEPAFPTPDNTDKVHTFKPANINCPNGKKTSRIVHLSATKDKGSYYIVAYLKYKDWTKKLPMHLPIN